MRILTRRLFLSLLSLSLILLGLPPTLLAAAPAERSAQITILQLNDLYDITPSAQGKTGGLARVATMRDRIAKEAPNTLLVLAGDFLSPSTMSSIFQGQQMVAALNAAGLDLVTREVVMGTLRGIATDSGLTVIVATQHVDLARRSADRILGFRAGCLVFDGPAQELTDAEAQNILHGRAFGRLDPLSEAAGDLEWILP